MPVLPLLQIHPGIPASSPDILRTPAREVTDFSPAVCDLSADLLDTLRRHGADGIAAPQAGIPLRLAIVEQERRPPLILVNPRVTAEAGSVSEGLEACLSLPGIRCVVKRPGALEVAYQDLAGVRHVLEVQARNARIIAHEVDHLGGIPGPAGRPGSEGAGAVPGDLGPLGTEPGASRGAGAPLDGALCTDRAIRVLAGGEP